jgi:hypothetical protein
MLALVLGALLVAISSNSFIQTEKEKIKTRLRFFAAP